MDGNGKDLGRLYTYGHDGIFHAARNKMPDLKHGKRGNLRVTRDVLWNGAFSPKISRGSLKTWDNSLRPRRGESPPDCP